MPRRGDTKNPYAPECDSGGSSAGSAAGVAANFATAAVGTDCEGSIRVPASFSNLVGLRPTVETVSRAGVLPLVAPRSWAERAYPHLIYYNQVDKGGHFAAWEQPQLFSQELRAAFRTLR